MTTLAGTPCLNSAPATPPQQTDVPNADIAEHLQPATRDCLPMSNVGRTAAPSAGFEKSGEPPGTPFTRQDGNTGEVPFTRTGMNAKHKY